LGVPAQATVLQIVSLDDLVAQSDVIVSGEVLAADGHLVRGHIETTVKVKVTERWKGKTASNEVTLIQLGGTIEEPLPLGQAVPGLPSFAPKEKVILFLSTKPPKLSPGTRDRLLAANGGALPDYVTTPRVVGGFQGKYNVYTDPETKKSMVIRQSAMAAQGTDPANLPPEVQARLAESVAMTDPSEMAPPPDGQLSSPAPATAVPFDTFRTRVRKLVGPEESARAAIEPPPGGNPSAMQPLAEPPKKP